MGKKNRRGRQKKTHAEKEEERAATNAEKEEERAATNAAATEIADDLFCKSLLRIVRFIEKSGGPIEDYLVQNHFLTVCDGEFILVSHLVADTQRCGIQLDCFINTYICYEDRIRAVTFRRRYNGESVEDFLIAYRDERCMPSVKVPYSVCKKIVGDCLLHMKENSKVFPSTKEKAIARLFGLPTTSRPTGFHIEHSLPEPKPAPDIESLWLVSCRPECFLLMPDPEVMEIAGFGLAGRRKSTPATFRAAMGCASKSKLKRQRMYATMHFMACWYSLNNGQEISAWLLWEVASMQDYTCEQSAIDRLESNVYFQLMINRYFDIAIDMGLKKPELKYPASSGLHGVALTRYELYMDDLKTRGSLPPDLFLTAGVAEKVVLKDGTIGSSDERNYSSVASFKKLTKQLERVGCAVCGITSSQKGDTLMACSGCKCVLYCGEECQGMGWTNGHAEECKTTVFEQSCSPSLRLFSIWIQQKSRLD